MKIQLLQHSEVFAIDLPALEEYLIELEDGDWAPCLIENVYFDNHKFV